MPVRPQPFTFTCDSCGWKKTIAPRSDALGPGEWCDRCERCGSTSLSFKTAGVIDRTLAQWFARLRR
ncbi:hypothetical protein NPS29_15460 [Pseudomonas putida]|jgi:hypothetical protein|uniref:hypothetical protein n=1 Tax=Pseudomonas TaxID=286 RepID=UPI002363BAFB|nr:hypothetical protein [Pseudomonas putida]MDD1966729.1 hypothetical protein [Pseudomonas putida]